MPYGKGTYGSKVGRPPKKKKQQSLRRSQLSDERPDTRWQRKFPEEDRSEEVCI